MICIVNVLSTQEIPVKARGIKSKFINLINLYGILKRSITGKVVIDAFRLINPNMMVLGQEPRQTTSNLGHLQKPSVQV